MTLIYFRSALVLSVLGLLGACGDDGGPELPVQEIFIGGGSDDLGCIQPTFPAEQPDLFALSPPIFLLTTPEAESNSLGQAQIGPGDLIEARIPVDPETRQVFLELTDAWRPGVVIGTEEFQTGGNQTISVAMFAENNVQGRYYMKLTLCGNDCRQLQVVFETVPCPEDEDPTPECGINVPYQRSVIENGEVTQVVDTCVDLGATLNVGSGSLLIQ